MFLQKAPFCRARTRRALVVAVAFGLPLSFAEVANAQIVAAPPPDATPIVGAVKPDDAPKIAPPPNGTSVTLSAGGQLATGNSRLLAITGNGVYASRYGANGFGASILGNYGQGAPPNANIVETSENLQGRIRYDRYVLDHMSLFLIATGRHDRFQGLDFRLNLDPGVKYIFVDEKATSFWGEAGYDFQYDIRDTSALGVVDPTTMAPVDIPGTMTQEQITRTASDHSARLFVGLRHAFNDAVTFSTGLEYLQSFAASKDPYNTSATGTDYRINYDAIFAAKVGGGLSVGFGFTARYDHDPIPGKEALDTTTSVNLIYGFSDLPKPPVDCSACQAPPPPASTPSAVQPPMSVTSPDTTTAPPPAPPSPAPPPPPAPPPTPAPAPNP
jgi:hypothetical protein